MSRLRRYLLHSCAAYAVLGLLVLVALDVDGDKRAGWQEFSHASSAFQADPHDPDRDGIPHDLELPDHEALPDIHVEFVLADRAMEPDVIRALVPALTDHLREIGFALVVHLSPLSHGPSGWKEAARVGFDSPLALESRFLSDPTVRTALVVRDLEAGPAGAADGRAQGHAMLLDYHALATGPDQDAGRLVLHELGHTLGLCHAHQDPCLTALPLGQQAAARESVMSYESSTAAWTWTPAQVETMHRGVACLPAQMHREPGASPPRQAQIKGFTAGPVAACPNGFLAGMATFWKDAPGPAGPWIATAPVAALVALAGQWPRRTTSKA